MQRLTFEELLAFVGLPFAVLATAAAITMVSHRQTRAVLWACLTVWTAFTSVVLLQHYKAGGREAQPGTSLTDPAPNAGKAGRPAITKNPSPPAPVVHAAPQPPRPEPADPPRPASPAVSAPVQPVESLPADLNAIRARFVGRWTGPLPSSGSPPTVMTLTFHANGRMEQAFSEVERPGVPGQKEVPDLRKGYVKGQLVTFRALESPIRYDVPTRDSVVFGRGLLSQRRPFRFAGPDTLVWTQAILNRRGETTVLVRVRGR